MYVPRQARLGQRQQQQLVEVHGALKAGLPLAETVSRSDVKSLPPRRAGADVIQRGQ